MTKRLDYIDVMRGIAMLLVIFEHCIGSLEEPTARFILSFHMPLFFFISGCFLKPIKESGIGGGISLIKKKAKAILVPQLTFGIIAYISTIVFDVFIKKSITISQVSLSDTFGSWFLVTLFLMEMIAIPLITFIQDRKVLFAVTLALFIGFYLTDYSDIKYVQQTLAATVFGLAGYLCKSWVQRYNESSSQIKGFGWCVLLVLGLLSMYNDPIGMYINQYGNKLYFVLVSFLAIYAILDISVSLKNTTFIQWCGRESIILYVLHPPLVRIIMNLCEIATPSFIYYQYPFYIITFFIVMAFLIPASRLCGKYFKFAFGKW